MDTETATPIYPEIIELDLSTVVPCLAGPKRPQDRVLIMDLFNILIIH